jgi:hypothetical protein
MEEPMTKLAYAAPEVLELGDAVVLTKGSYPHNPETNGNTDQTATNLDLDRATLNEMDALASNVNR